jgi:glutamine synthetase
VTHAEILAEVEARGIETLRLSFADQHGILRGKTLTPRALKGALEGGVAMTSTLLLKDTSHRTVFPVWGAGSGLGEGRLDGAGDVLMIPDASTFRALPLSPHSGWMLCDLAYKDGTPLPFCPRGMLKRAVSELEAAGLRMRAGLEVEFHIHRVTAPNLAHDDGGMPGRPPDTEALNHGFQYLTEARYAEIEDVLDDIRRAAEGLGLPVRSVEIEFGPSQVEFTFDAADPLTQADTLVLFRTTVKEVCRRQGLHASFMCRPRTATRCHRAGTCTSPSRIWRAATFSSRRTAA